MVDIRFDTTNISDDRRSELEAWVRGLIGAVADHVRPYGRIAAGPGGPLLHLSQVQRDHNGNVFLDEAKQPPETATIPLVIDLKDQPPWPRWLGDLDYWNRWPLSSTDPGPR